MKSEWEKIKLKKVIVTNEQVYSPKENWDYVNYLDTGNITENKINEIQHLDLSKVKLPLRARRKVKYNDIVYSTVRPNQRHFGIIKDVPKNFLVSTGFTVISTDSRKANSDYIYYLLTQSDVVEYLHTIAEQSVSAYPSIKSSNIEEIEVYLPSLDTQNKIVSVLMAISDKIALNNRINDNLEQQARMLYKAWFLDFEPFGGVMPTSWMLSTLGNVATIKTRSFSPKKNPSVILEHYSIPAYDEKHYPVFELAEGVKSNKYILTSASVMISKLNPDTKRIWRPFCLSDNPVCSTEFIIYEATNFEYKDFVYSIIDSTPFSDYLCAHTTGSTNSRQRATPSVTLDFPIIVADDAVIKDFCGLVTPMYDHIATNICESQQLAALRDSLLPRLMSGELDVSNIDL